MPLFNCEDDVGPSDVAFSDTDPRSFFRTPRPDLIAVKPIKHLFRSVAAEFVDAAVKEYLFGIGPLHGFAGNDGLTAGIVKPGFGCVFISFGFADKVFESTPARDDNGGSGIDGSIFRTRHDLEVVRFDFSDRR